MAFKMIMMLLLDCRLRQALLLLKELARQPVMLLELVKVSACGFVSTQKIIAPLGCTS
jgi:hypothetical protein